MIKKVGVVGAGTMGSGIAALVASAGGRMVPLVQRAGGSNADPNIRSRVNQDTKTINDSDKSFIDSLIFWQETPPSGVVVDPSKEQQRIRDAQAAGQAVENCAEGRVC